MSAIILIDSTALYIIHTNYIRILIKNKGKLSVFVCYIFIISNLFISIYFQNNWLLKFLTTVLQFGQVLLTFSHYFMHSW